MAQPQSQNSVLYNGLEIELQAPRDGDDNKKLYTFDESYRALQQRGFNCHLLPFERSALFCARLEGKLRGAQETVVNDMHLSFGEWEDVVELRQGDVLHIYEHPRRIRLNSADNKYDCKKSVYHCSGMLYTHHRQFSIKGLPLDEVISIKDVAKRSPALVRYLYSRNYQNLPLEIREGGGTRILSEEGNIWPITTKMTTMDNIHFKAASRGVINHAHTQPKVWHHF